MDIDNLSNIPESELGEHLFQLLRDAALQHRYHYYPLDNGKNYLQVETSLQQDNFLFHMRDAVSYREQCALYHLRVLRNIINSHQRKAEEDVIASMMSQSLLRNLGNEVMYVFDDLIFHSISLFDYLANFLAYPFTEGAIKEESIKIKWNQLVGRCKSKKDVIHRQTSYAAVVLQYHNSFVQLLANYRGNLYHFKNDFAPTEGSFHELEGTANLRVGFPKRFLEIFEDDFKDADTSELTILDASSWVYSQSIKIAIVLLQHFHLDVAKKNFVKINQQQE